MSISANLNSLGPLSPQDFLADAPRPNASDLTKPLDVFGTDTVESNAAADGPFDVADRINLQTALNLYRDARAKLQSPIADTVKAAAWDVAQIASYIVGYFDGKGLLNVQPPHAGFSSFDVSKPKLSMIDQLDQLDLVLTELIGGAETRRPNGTKVLLNSAGDYCIGIAGSLTASVIFALAIPTP